MKLFFILLVSTCIVSTTHAATGLNYYYYEGSWDYLPDFTKLTPVKSGTSANVDITLRNREEKFAFLWQGYLTIATAGTYTFETFSDDGSKFYINNYATSATALVNNDALHGSRSVSGAIYLNAGTYPIAVSYFNYLGTYSVMDLYWSSNTGIARQKIPGTAFTTSLTTTTSSGALSYSCYEGSWDYLPDFTKLTPVKTGTSANVDLNVRSRDEKYAILWQGAITIPTSGTYTFETFSDDGSKFYINNYATSATALVNNDALHGSRSVTGSIYLNAGTYPIAISYFNYLGTSSVMDVYWWSNTGIARQKIPDNAFGSTSTAPTSGPLSYNYYEGTWDYLPDFSALTPAKSGTSANVDLNAASRTERFAMLWQGSINIATAGTYTFETISDDGSKFYVNNYATGATALVNNDALHGIKSVSASIYLNAGTYPIAVSYFNNAGSPGTMEIYWSSNSGIARQKIPDNAFGAAAKKPDDVIKTPDVVGGGSGGLTGVNNYYFSSTIGDDSRSSTEAQNPLTPWKTLNKANSFGFKAGDALLFKRGDVFDGGLTISASGTSSTPLIYSAYGTGNRPVINGLTTLTNWASVGNGIWEASCPSTTNVNMVTLNNKPQALGRYPNITDANRGYLKFESHYSSWQITDYQLPAYPNWTGAEVVIRKNAWVLDRGIISGHSGGTINYNSTNYDPLDNCGYFIQNSPQTLDQLGEWYFDPYLKKIKVYLGQVNPYAYDVKASVTNNLVYIDNKVYVTFDNLAFTGSDEETFKLQRAGNIIIQNCDISNSGVDGINGINSYGITVQGSTIKDINNCGISFVGGSYITVKDNIIKNCGILLGMGKSNNQFYDGIYIEGNNYTIEANNLDSIGYCGISFTGGSVLIKNNVINHFTLSKDDGGGIYGWGDLDKYDRKIIGNIIMNGIGAFEGSNHPINESSSGILLDDLSANVEMTDNTVVNCSRAGIYIHNSHEINIQGNTLFDNSSQLSLVQDAIAPNHPIRNINMSNGNILFAKKISQNIMHNGTSYNDVKDFGYFNNNYYTKPVDENGINVVNYRDQAGSDIQAFYDLDGWRLSYGFDGQTGKSPIKMPGYVVNSYNGGNRYNNGNFNNGTNGINCGTGLGSCSVSWNSGGRLDGGAVQVSYQPVAGSNNNLGTYINLGSVQAGRNYLVKFTLVGNLAGKTMKGFIMQNGGSYSILSEIRFFQLTNTRTENTFLYTSATNEANVMIVLEVHGQDIPFWLDNMEMYDVNATLLNADDYMRYEYNPTGSNKTIGLDATYYDVKNNAYPGSITLAPYKSAILMKQPPVSAAAPIASAGNAGISAAINANREGEADFEVTDDNALSFRVSPNPSSDKIQIFVKGTQNSKETILSIHSAAGAVLKTISVTKTNQVVAVDISSWASGAYFINLVSNGHVINKKFIKQ